MAPINLYPVSVFGVLALGGAVACLVRLLLIYREILHQQYLELIEYKLDHKIINVLIHTNLKTSGDLESISALVKHYYQLDYLLFFRMERNNLQVITANQNTQFIENYLLNNREFIKKDLVSNNSVVTNLSHHGQQYSLGILTNELIPDVSIAVIQRQKNYSMPQISALTSKDILPLLLFMGGKFFTQELNT